MKPPNVHTPRRFVRAALGLAAVPAALIVVGVASLVYRHAGSRRCTKHQGWRDDG